MWLWNQGRRAALFRLIHVAGLNLGVLMRSHGTWDAEGGADAAFGRAWIVRTNQTWAAVLVASEIGDEPAFLVIEVMPKCG